MPFAWSGNCKHCGNRLALSSQFPSPAEVTCEGCGWSRIVTAAELEQNPVAVWNQTPDSEMAEALCVALEEATIQLDALNVGMAVGSLQELEAVLSKYVAWDFDMDPGTGGLARRRKDGEQDAGAEAAGA